MSEPDPREPWILQALTTPAGQGRELSARFERLEREVRRRCTRRRVPDAIRDDVVNDLLLKIFRQIQRGGIRLEVQYEGAASSYLERMLVSLFVDHLRKRNARMTEPLVEERIEAPRYEEPELLSGEVADVLERLDATVCERRPALCDVREQVFALARGEARSLDDFLDADPSPDTRAKERATLQQQHSRWRKAMADETQARALSGTMEPGTADAVMQALVGLRQRAPSKP
ncbi:MAG: hypothetical protein Q8Q09_24570 [Deltaproteobacteria bacterium]|nr:hypothetical protein [Deltaproteobacteria bacterium]